MKLMIRLLGLTALCAMVDSFVQIPTNLFLRDIFKRTTKVPWPKDTAPDPELIHTYDSILSAESEQSEPVKYPDYYLKPFHCYDKGNLCWEAALEAEVANQAVLTSAGMDSESIRGAFVNETIAYMKRRTLRPEMDQVLDVGCSTGISSDYAARLDLCANVTGIDLSPHFLSVGMRLRDSHKYVHANAEQTPFEDNTFDAATVSFVLHELPAVASERVIMETARILRRGGLIAILDMGARIRASGPLKQFIFDRTEPHLEEYMAFTPRIKDVMHYAGFVGFETVAVTDKYTAYFAFKGASGAVKTPGLVDSIQSIVKRRRDADSRRAFGLVSNVVFGAVEIAVLAFLAKEIASIVEILMKGA